MFEQSPSWESTELWIVTRPNLTELITGNLTPNQTAALHSVLLTSWNQWLLPHAVIPNKDRRATDSCFALIRAHQCGVLMDVLGWLVAYVSATSANTCGFNKGREGGYADLVLGWLGLGETESTYICNYIYSMLWPDPCRRPIIYFRNYFVQSDCACNTIMWDRIFLTVMNPNWQMLPRACSLPLSTCPLSSELHGLGNAHKLFRSMITCILQYYKEKQS